MKSFRLQMIAMTLVEILAVVVILGLLAVTLTLGISGKIGKARSEIAKAQIAQIISQVQTFELDARRLPKAGEGLIVLSADPKSSYYLDPNKLQDPWGRPYIYLVPGPRGESFEIMTYGADGQPGGTGEDKDVSSRNDNPPP